MANPLWKIGSPSANPAGRPRNKHSAITVKGLCERFIKQQIKTAKITKLFNSLAPAQQLELLALIIPYTTAKPTPDSISHEEAASMLRKLDEAQRKIETLQLQHGEAI